MTRYILIFSLCVIASTSFGGCFPGNGVYTNDSPAGFFSGIWHGWIAPISLTTGFFNDEIRIYETNNTGWWYDFGYYIAVISGFGGIAFFRKRGKKGSKPE